MIKECLYFILYRIRCFKVCPIKCEKHYIFIRTLMTLQDKEIVKFLKPHTHTIT